MEKHIEVERSIIKKYRKNIWKRFIAGINEYEMIKPGDKIAVCISGGKDSMLLAKCIQQLQKHSDFPFEAKYLVLDPGYSQENIEKIKYNANLLDIPIEIFEGRIFDYVVDVEDNPCYMCARMRRGHLYKNALLIGCNKIALGHHQDDILHTALMNLSFNGTFSTMPALLRMRKFPISIIRPLCLEHETDIAFLAKQHDYVKQVKRCPHEKESRRTEAATQFEQLCRFAPEFRQNLWHALLKEGKLVETE